MTEQEQCKISMSKSGCAELMVTVCTYSRNPVQQLPSKGWFISISISFCSFVMHVCPNLAVRMAARFKRRKKEKKERKQERKKKKKENK